MILPQIQSITQIKLYNPREGRLIRNFQILVKAIIDIMIKSIIGKIKKINPTIFSRNHYPFYNEVPKFDPSKDYYSILEVSKNSSESEIKRQYYTLAKKYHPDSNKGFEAKFKEINEAYTVLSDPKIKRQYDSARLMTGFSRKMGSKAGEGTFDYREYQAEFHKLSPEQRKQLAEQFRRKMRKVIIFGIVMIVVLPFLTRRNHRYYILQNGELLPVQFQGGSMGGMSPPPGMMGPYGAAPYPGQQAYGQQVQPFSQVPPQGYQSPYSQPYSNPYSQVARNVNPNPYGGYRQSNYQPGYSGPSGPQ